MEVPGARALQREVGVLPVLGKQERVNGGGGGGGKRSMGGGGGLKNEERGWTGKLEKRAQKSRSEGRSVKPDAPGACWH